MVALLPSGCTQIALDPNYRADQIGAPARHDGRMLTLDQLDHAAAVIAQHFAPTPQYRWPLLEAEVGTEVWVKHEDATPAGAFKVRGGLVYMERLARERRAAVAGVCSATRGNHGISLSQAGRAYGVPVVIVVPEGNSVEKNAAMAALGAEVVVHGRDFKAAREHAGELAAIRGLEMVPPFHPDLVAGVATYARELFDAVDDLTTVYVPVGMGSGINALIEVRDLLGLSTEIVGVVAEEAPATALSFAAGEVVTTATAATFVDGVATRQPDPDAIARICDGAARVLTASETAVADAMRTLFRCCHHLPEPAGAIALAGLMSERERIAGQRVALILSGANLDTSMAAQVLAGATPAP
jgi:threonine dehydratase